MSNRESEPESATRFTARAAWAKGMLDDFLLPQINHAIFRRDEIAIEWGPTDGETTQITLTNSGEGRYSGKAVWGARTPRQETATVEAQLYSNANGHVLVGSEYWSSGATDWFIVELSNPQQV